MALTVKHLNGDTTFLLTFAPTDQKTSATSDSSCQTPGSFTVLLDPWLSGSSSMWHPKFLLSKHTTPSCIRSLSHIPEPNIVLISQVKPDHCHELTLRQLDPTSPITSILAEPAAAKKIRGMKHFHPSMVHNLRPYSDKTPDSVIRFYIPPVVCGGSPGEVTISFIPAKMDVAGVHNAIGITYRPPSTSQIVARPFSPRSITSNQKPPLSSHMATHSANLPMTPPDSPTQREMAFNYPPSTSTTASTTHPSESILSSTHQPSVSSVSSISSIGFHNGNTASTTEKALSVIYSPHGVDYSLIRTFASSHLVRAAALPLTLLLHSFDRVSNPWWMGGNVAAGLPGGVEIAKNLMARCWISAHDEDKDNSGLSVKNVKIRKFTQEEVREMLWAEQIGSVDVYNLGVGEEKTLKT